LSEYKLQVVLKKNYCIARDFGLENQGDAVLRKLTLVAAFRRDVPQQFSPTDGPVLRDDRVLMCRNF